MIYGPTAGDCIRKDLAALAKDIGKTPRRIKDRKYRYSVGSGNSFGVKQFDLARHQDRLKAVHYTLEKVLADSEHNLPVTDHPRFVWIDDNPRWSDYKKSKEAPMPSVAIEIRSETGWIPLTIDGSVMTDEGLDFVTIVVASLMNKTRWSTIWIPPHRVQADPTLNQAEYRFTVRGNTGVFKSPSFTLESARAHSGLTGIAREAYEKKS